MEPSHNNSEFKIPEWLASEFNMRPAIRIRTIIFYAITFVVLIYIYRHLQEIVLIKDFFSKSNWSILLLILALQFGTYYFIALTYQDVLKIKGFFLSVKKLLPLTFVIQFLNQALPSATISGQVFFIQYLRQFKVSIAEGISRAILEMAALYSAFGLYFFIALYLLFHQHISSHTELIQFLIYLFIFVVILFSLIFFAIQRQGRKRMIESLITRMHDYLERNRYERISNHLSHLKTIASEVRTTLNIQTLKPKGWIFWRAMLWQMMVLTLDIATLYTIADTLDFHIPISIIVITFILSQFLSMMAFVPGAVGIFEGSMTLIFISFGIPANPALAVTLLYRTITFWLPMPIGWMLYRGYVKMLNALEDAKKESEPLD